MLWMLIGEKDKNKIRFGLNLTSAPENSDAFTVDIYDDQAFNAIREAEAGREKMPRNKGAATLNIREQTDRMYDGGHGDGEAWVAVARNMTAFPIVFQITVLERNVGYCSDKTTGTYWESFWWTTCDEKLLRAFGIIP